ncbi:ATP-dependent DNA helicase RecG [Agaribacterium sp. ZY112]|uniref:ATP-dependent DNA helicase RecG n=1 Tax=Agaribacterium sp. ZY112 TaxID=3233574 RepID=UPI00352617B4
MNSSAAPSLAQLPLTALHGVGAKFAETLSKLDLYNVQDLLFHLPFRYVDRSRVRSIGSLRMGDMALIEARVLTTQVQFGRRRSLSVKVEDDSGLINLRFFHFNAAQKNSFDQGRLVRLFGELRPGSSGLEIYHPEFEFIDAPSSPHDEEAKLTPIYNLCDGVSQPRIRKLCEQAIELLHLQAPDELLGEQVNQHFAVNSLAQALAFIHSPPADTNQQQLFDGEHPAQQRLAFEELLAHYLVHQRQRAAAREEHSPSISVNATLLQPLLDQLPFEPTAAQKRVINEIAKDLKQSHPMLRMVQGDVGSGKTLVAAMAALAAVRSGQQVALVAPTEILAEQHLRSFKQWLEPLGIQLDLLVGKLTAKQKTSANAKLLGHETDIVIGTHALFQDNVRFRSLGLVIIDEQHRFGVAQRLSLRDKNDSLLVPHQLVMTATPIPRTLAMTSYAELDFSIIDELPPGRTPIQTVAISQKRKNDIIERVDAAVTEGRQVYWVCPLIEESETLSAANAETTYAELKEALPHAKCELIHGRLKPAEKEQRMASFKQGHSRILVATTVIEVGVDVPQASVMIIENPERLGLAQLHQLRGRVGRGSTASHCVLLHGDKLSQHGKQRLAVLRESSDGFYIAEKDLEMRGPGEFLGKRQAGDMLYRVAHHERDAHMLDLVHEYGQSLIQQQPETVEKLIQRWFGQRQDYALA